MSVRAKSCFLQPCMSRSTDSVLSRGRLVRGELRVCAFALGVKANGNPFCCELIKVDVDIDINTASRVIWPITPQQLPRVGRDNTVLLAAAQAERSQVDDEQPRGTLRYRFVLSRRRRYVVVRRTFVNKSGVSATPSVGAARFGGISKLPDLRGYKILAEVRSGCRVACTKRVKSASTGRAR